MSVPQKILKNALKDVLVSEAVSAMMGLGAGVGASAATTNLNLFNTNNSSIIRGIDYTPINRSNQVARSINPNFNTQLNYFNLNAR